jgi:hypothetical protein
MRWMLARVAGYGWWVASPFGKEGKRGIFAGGAYI